MTDFTDRVILRLNGSLPVIQLPTDAVKNIWWFEDGKWAPIGFTNHGNSYLTLTDYNNNPPDTPLNLFAYTIAGTGGEPILTIDRGVTVQKDLTAGGFVCSNQGELWLGSGRDNQLDVPKIILQNSGASILNGGGFCDIPPIPTGHAGSGSFPAGQPAGTYYLRTDANEPYHNRVFKFDGSNWNDTTPDNPAASQLFRSTNAVFGEAEDTIFKSARNKDTELWSWSKVGPASDYAGRYFDTLYLTKLDGTPAHLDLGDLTIEGQLKLQSQNKKIFGVAAGDNGTADNYAYLIPINPPNGTLGLGTYAYPFEWIDVYSVFTNEIRNLQSFPRIRMALRRLFGDRSSDMMQKSALDQEETVTAVVIDNDEIAGLKQKHLNGLIDEWYSDEEITLKAKVDGTTGHITANGLTVNGNANIAGYAQFNNDAKLIWVNTSTLEVQTAGGDDGALNVGNLYVSGNINPLGAQGYIGFNTKLRLSGDFQIADGHVVSSLNPSGSVGLGSPTEPWTGVTAQTVYTESIKHLNGSDWNIPQVQKGSITTNASGVASITFPQSFASTPSITCTPVDSSGRHIAVVITAQSATQFSIKTTVIGDHKHKVGDIFGTDTFGLSVDSASDHTHSFTAGAHTHMIGTISATTGWTMGIDSQGSHNHTVVGTTGTGSSHSHTVNSHTHSMTGASGSGTTGTTSGHTHSYTYYYVSGWVTAGSSPSTTSESSHTHYYSGYSGDNGSHSHNLTNKPPYVRSLMLRDSGGAQHDLGALLSNTSDSQFDFYTLSGGSGSGTTGSAGGHTHSLSGKPAYTRGVSLRNSSGGSFTIGGVLANESVVGTTEAHTETTNPVSNIAIAVNWIAVG